MTTTAALSSTTALANPFLVTVPPAEGGSGEAAPFAALLAILDGAPSQPVPAPALAATLPVIDAGLVPAETVSPETGLPDAIARLLAPLRGKPAVLPEKTVEDGEETPIDGESEPEVESQAVAEKPAVKVQITASVIPSQPVVTVTPPVPVVATVTQDRPISTVTPASDSVASVPAPVVPAIRTPAAQKVQSDPALSTQAVAASGDGALVPTLQATAAVQLPVELRGMNKTEPSAPGRKGRVAGEAPPAPDRAFAVAALASIFQHPEEGATPPVASSQPVPQTAPATLQSVLSIAIEPELVAETDVAAPVVVDLTPADSPIIDAPSPFGRTDSPATVVPPIGASAAAPALATPAASIQPMVNGSETAIQHHLDVAHDGEWLDRLARDIASIATDNARLRFQLNPEHLGSLQVELANGADGTSIRFMAETEAARALIADAQPRLLAEARAQGMRIADAQVDVGGQQTAGQQQQRPQPEAQPAGVRVVQTGLDEADAEDSSHNRERYA